MQGNFGLSLVLIVSVAAIDAGANDLYVSASNEDPGDGRTYSLVTNDLQAAIDKAASGDTVWVEDGFVCSTGATTNKSGITRLYVGKGTKLNVRSVSGDWRTGVIVRGSVHSDTAPLGTDAVRCLHSEENGIQFTGFVFEGGATTEGTSFGGTNSGGGIFGVGVYSNCCIRSCKAGRSGGIYSSPANDCILYDSVVTNCWSAGESGGVSAITAWNTRIVNNRAETLNGGIRGGNYRFCTIAGNHAKNGNGAGLLGAADVMEDSVILNNVAETGSAGAFGYIPHIVRCVLSGNCATNGSSGKGGAVCGTSFPNYPAVLTDCVLSNNVATGVGGAALTAVLTGCTLVDNVCSNEVNSGCGAGGAVSACILTNCTLAGNAAIGPAGNVYYGFGGAANESTLVGCVLSNNTTRSRGAALYKCSAWNCVIVGNTNYNNSGALHNNSGAVWGGTLYNSLVARNVALAGVAGVAGWASSPDDAGCAKVFNCTIVDNVSANGSGGCDGNCGVFAINTLVYRNTSETGTKDRLYWATNCCYDVSRMNADKAGENVVFGESQPEATPRFVTEDGFDYIPANKTLKNRARTLDWMTDLADPRSKALNGRARVLGRAPDIGAFEAKLRGLAIVFL